MANEPVKLPVYEASFPDVLTCTFVQLADAVPLACNEGVVALALHTKPASDHEQPEPTVKPSTFTGILLKLNPTPVSASVIVGLVEQLHDVGVILIYFRYPAFEVFLLIVKSADVLDVEIVTVPN